MKNVIISCAVAAMACTFAANAQVSAPAAPAAAKPEVKADLTWYNGKLINSDKKEGSIEGKKTVAFYYSAHWCGPCRMATPKLVEFYNSLTPEQKKNFEIVFVSSDRDEKSMLEYMTGAKMPWLAVKFDEARNVPVKNQSRGIPSLHVVDAEGKTVASGHPMQLMGKLKELATK